MPMYNLIEHSNIYSDTSGGLWQFKRDKVPANNVDLMSINNSQSFYSKAAVLGKTTDSVNTISLSLINLLYYEYWTDKQKHLYVDSVNNVNSSVKNTKVVVPIKYLRSFWRSIEMPWINCQIHLELNWIEKFILSSAGDSAKFEITDAKSHVPIVTLST